MTFEELEKKVISWASDRLIFEQSDVQAQLHKLDEEFHELIVHIANGDSFDKIADDLGDMLVVMILIAHFKGLNMTQCLDISYNEIKDRKGKMVNGIFVKEV